MSSQAVIAEILWRSAGNKLGRLMVNGKLGPGTRSISNTRYTGGDTRQLGAHDFEQRTGRFGMQILNVQTVNRRGMRIRYAQGRIGVAQYVGSGFIEELVGQRDMFRIDVLDL